MKNLFLLTLSIFAFSCSSDPEPATATPVPATSVTINNGAELNIKKLALNMGTKVTLSASVSPSDASPAGVTWASSDQNIATISTEGVITPVAVGTATITAITASNADVSASIPLTVLAEGTVKVLATISNVTTTRFTLTLDTAVAGLTVTNLALDNGATVIAVTPYTGNKVYAVEAALVAGTTYKLTITKEGYVFNFLNEGIVLPK